MRSRLSSPVERVSIWRYNLPMLQLSEIEAVDYLVIGHLTVDQTPDGPRLGGAATYAGLTARALGLRVGIVTAVGADAPLEPLQDVSVAGFQVDECTRFENIYTPAGRLQYLRAVAPALAYYHVPEAWRSAAIVHLGPVAQEVDPGLVRSFPSALIGVAPQGWLRQWGEDGQVSVGEWPEAGFVLERAGAAVISREDLGGDEERIDELVAVSRVLAVTEGSNGARIYWNGDVRRFRPPEVKEVDPTGAGDVFAAAFFSRLHTTRDPWEAGRFATRLAAVSVTRPGLLGVPTPAEVESSMVEVL